VRLPGDQFVTKTEKFHAIMKLQKVITPTAFRHRAKKRIIAANPPLAAFRNRVPDLSTANDATPSILGY
jgi:hypothetical protein